ncbi:hypothetical protein BaRGS_00000332, partial [Batillaria attramentaria]
MDPPWLIQSPTIARLLHPIRLTPAGKQLQAFGPVDCWHNAPCATLPELESVAAQTDEKFFAIP